MLWATITHHGHSHAPADASATRLKIALALLVGLMSVEVVAGVLANSLALLSDAAHMLTDAGALALALVALRLAARPAGGSLTYGLKRTEILSAQFNGATLLVLGLLIVYEGIRRLVDPPAVEGLVVFVVALVGVAVNLVATVVLHGGRPALIERRGRVPARPDRPRRVHRHGDRGPRHPADRLGPRGRRRLAVRRGRDAAGGLVPAA